MQAFFNAFICSGFVINQAYLEEMNSPVRIEIFPENKDRNSCNLQYVELRNENCG